MEGVLNSIIKFDLHIHSKASAYKESAGIVDQSTKENLHVLLSKLGEHNISLFSITDHNRFDVELYQEINRILVQDNNPYPDVKGVLAGVEFDVKLDDTMGKCHIIGIFDTKNELDKLKQIETGLQSNLLTEVDAAYSKDEFEDILKAIGLNTILIASQRKDIHNHSGKHNSLSDSIANVEEIIKVGYINALEFQKPKVEGILINNLKELSLPVPLFSGSDCHDWNCYPYHDKENQNSDFHHSRAKIMPTFKGLLMAVTSPETRFNCSENTNTNIIGGLNLQKQAIPLVNGINAIIGENGSGKTTLLKLINGKTKEQHVKKLINDNNLQVNDSIDPAKVKYIEQGQIIKKFNEQTLFTADEESNFKDIDNSLFKDAYSNYTDALNQGIKLSIKKKDKIKALSQYSIAFKEEMEANNYYIDITESKNIEDTNNPHEDARKEINDLVNKIKLLLSSDYYESYRTQLENILDELSSIRDDIEQKWSSVDSAAKVKNIMYGCIKDYLRKVKENSSAKDREIKEYSKKRQSMIDSVIETIKLSTENILWPSEPPILKGASKNPKRGFYFNREATYNGISMIDNFYSKMFLKDYSSIEKLHTIYTYDQFSGAVRNCTSPSDVETKWKENFKKFLDEAIKSKDYIMDGADQQVGNTLGEMSLSYYKFFTQDNLDWNVLIVDQPEDNISNNNISKKLINYFNAIRNEKQLIFVTHNPLLVVNLDVDNVIFIKNENGIVSVNNGCLEYEDDQINILEIIAQNMDGGKETIEKRLKVYGKNY